MRQELRKLDPQAAILTEAERAGHQLLAFASRLQRLDILGVFLAVALLELGLGVEQVDVAGPAHLHQHDHRSGPRGEMARRGGSSRRAASRRPAMSRRPAPAPASTSGPPGRNRVMPAQKFARLRQPVAFNRRALRTFEILVHRRHSTYRNSLALSSVWQSCEARKRWASFASLPADCQSSALRVEQFAAGGPFAGAGLSGQGQPESLVDLRSGESPARFATRLAKCPACSARNLSLSITSDCSGTADSSRRRQLVATSGWSKIVRIETLYAPPRHQVHAPPAGLLPDGEVYPGPRPPCRRSPSESSRSVPQRAIQGAAGRQDRVANHLRLRAAATASATTARLSGSTTAGSTTAGSPRRAWEPLSCDDCR